MTTQRRKSDPSTGSVEVLMLTVNQTAEALQLGYSTVVRMIRADEIAAVKWGKEWRVPVAEIQAVIKDLMEKSAEVRAARFASAA